MVATSVLIVCWTISILGMFVVCLYILYKMSAYKTSFEQMRTLFINLVNSEDLVNDSIITLSEYYNVPTEDLKHFLESGGKNE